MTTAVLTPVVSKAAKPIAGRMFRKQVLPRGSSITYRDKVTGQVRKLDFSDDYLKDIVDAFDRRAYDTVKFQIADKDNTHTEDPERARGTVRALELTSDGLDMIVDLTDEGAKLVSDHPDLPVSARIAEGLERADGAQFPAAIKHVLGTLDPCVAGMSPWKSVDLTNDPDPIVDLTAADYKKEHRMTDTVLTKLRKAFGLADSATEDEIVATAEEKAKAAEEEPEELTPEDLAALEALTHSGEPVSLTAEVQRQIDLANANAEQAVQAARAVAEKAEKAAWAAESAALLGDGVPKALVDLAAPWCGGEAPAGFVDLANSETTVDTVRQAAAADMRKMLEAHKGLIDLSVIGEAPDPAADDGVKEKLDAWDKMYPAKQ